MGQVDRPFSLLWAAAAILVLVTAVLPFAGSPAARASGCDAYPSASPAYLKGYPKPIAASGSLPASGSATVTVVANDTTGNCVSGAPIYVSFSNAVGGGTAVANTAAMCQNGGNGTLTSNFGQCTTDGNGAVTITYSAPSTLPNGGTDWVRATTTLPFTASNAGSFETGYTYGSMSVTPKTVTAVEGTAFSGTVASFIAQSIDTSKLAATIAWGDGSTTAGTIVVTPGTAPIVTGAHTYTEERTSGYATTVTVAGRTGPSASASGLATVSDAPLTATGTNLSFKAKRSSTMTVATFTDADPAGAATDYSATVDWGDGSSSSGAVAASSPGFKVTGAHSYNKRGNFTVTVRILDAGGASATATSTASVR